MELDKELIAKLKLLEDKYEAMGQDMESYLTGLLHADYLTYWDYIHLDTLLSLQTPKTRIPDEEIFIIYHQITELYFKLILKAIKQLTKTEKPTAALAKRQMQRVSSYFNHLVNSFDVMVEGMDKDEFLKFRMSLLPASGFQSAQYREIEIVSTNLYQLTHFSKRENYDDNKDIDTRIENLYWKSGATELATGKKTLTLRQFEEKYKAKFIRLAKKMEGQNLQAFFKKYPQFLTEEPDLKNLLRELDLNANVRWPLAHFKSAMRYLDRKPAHIEATGGTNWQKYLPPKNQRVIFFPELWTAEELDAWGTTQFQ